MAFDDRSQKAFDFAQEVTKQLITLSTSIVALTITFLHDIIGGGTSGDGLLKAAWILYASSVVFGVLALMALTGNLEQQNPTVYAGNVRAMSIVQVALFLAALAFTIAFGFKVTKSF
jgi:uncharacterized membrane protein